MMLRRPLVVLFLLITTLGGCRSSAPTSSKSEFSNERRDLRKPASTEEFINGSAKILKDLQDPSVFNPSTCPQYVESLTSTVFSRSSEYFIPKSESERQALATQGPQILETLFSSRLALRQKLIDFDAAKTLTPQCVLYVREGLQFLRFAEEFLLEWLVQQKAVPKKTTKILDNEAPYTMTNPKFTGFKLKAGDIMTIRGKSYVSAMIARIGDEEGNFSHLAIIGEDRKGRLYVVESLIQKGVIITPLEKWRKAEDARVALYRQPDESLAHRSAQAIYEHANSYIKRGKNIRYDFAMDDENYSSIFCSEVGKYAYDKGSNGTFIIPKFRTQASKFKNTEYLKSLGVARDNLFAPFDMEVDPRFELVAEYRYLPLLRQVRMQDAVLQSIYSWMTKDGYDFYFSLPVTGKAYFAKFVRQFGFGKDSLPKYMPMTTIFTTLKFEAVATTLEKNIYKIESEYFKKHGHSLAFRDMMAINDAYREKDCSLHEVYLKRSNDIDNDIRTSARDSSVFHWFFNSKAQGCK